MNTSPAQSVKTPSDIPAFGNLVLLNQARAYATPMTVPSPSATGLYLNGLYFVLAADVCPPQYKPAFTTALGLHVQHSGCTMEQADQIEWLLCTEDPSEVDLGKGTSMAYFVQTASVIAISKSPPRPVAS